MRSPSVVVFLLACAAPGCAERRGTPVEEGSLLVARDEGGRSVTLRVDGVMRDPKDADGDLFLYELSVRDAGGGFSPFCLPDREGRRLAVPVQAELFRVAEDGLVPVGRDRLPRPGRESRPGWPRPAPAGPSRPR